MLLRVAWVTEGDLVSTNRKGRQWPLLGGGDAINALSPAEITQLGRKTFVQSMNSEKASGRLKNEISPRVSSNLVLGTFLFGFCITVTELKK